MPEKTIIHLLETKEALYFELQALLDEETRLLGSPEMEVKNIWAFTEEKNRLSMEIEAMRKEILAMATQKLGLSDPSPIHLRELPRLFPEEELRITRSVETIIFLKGKIRKVAEANITFVESYLGTIEEVIDILTSTNTETPTYGINRHMMTQRTTALIQGEA